MEGKWGSFVPREERIAGGGARRSQNFGEDGRRGFGRGD